MRIDLHCHEMTYSKCSNMRIEDIVCSAKEKGLDAICVTDHDSMGIRYAALDYGRSANYKIFIGIEVSAMHGDIIVFGPDIDFKTYMIETQALLDFVNAHDGFCYAAHPFRGSGCGYYASNLKNLHGIEVKNGRAEKEANQKASRLCDELGLIPLAGSDAHDIGEIGRCPMRVPDDVSTSEELAKALKSGACEIIQ